MATFPAVNLVTSPLIGWLMTRYHLLIPTFDANTLHW